MKLTSPAFNHKEEIPQEYTCEGKNTAPSLHIREVPSQAKTLVLLMEDPDVPLSIRQDRLWIHWVLFNIPPSLSHLEEETLQGTRGKNTSGTLHYRGPCPPDGRHRYYFKLYALDTDLSLKEGATRQEVLQAMEGHVLAYTELMGTYEKKHKT